MIKLNKQVEDLKAIQEKIQAKMDAIQAKMDAIKGHACDLNRKLTRAEQNRLDRLYEPKNKLRNEYYDIQDAIEWLIDYCD